MLKKKLQSLTPLSSTLFRRAPPLSPPPPPPLSSDTYMYNYSTSSNFLSRSFTNLFPSYEIKQNSLPFPLSSPRVFLKDQFQNPSLHFTFSSAADKSFRCWNCNAAASVTMAFLFCDACRSIQPVDHSIDYFHIFGLEKKYELEEGNLEGKYKDWQKKLHPDLVHTKSKEEREYAAEQSARVITAYRTLTNPLSRAIYILKLEGVEVDEEGRISDPELLSEIMEIREAVEEAGDSQTLNQIQEQMQKKLGEWSKFFADALDGKRYDEALASIQRMTYYKRAIEEVVKKL